MKYSVIVPVYNAEKTISRCVESLLAENYSDMEIILVDDGSSDSSGAICSSYAENNDCVRYFRKENGGVSTARNAGLVAASGIYVLFVDSDDYVIGDFFLTLDTVLEKTVADLIQFSYINENKTETNTRQFSPLMVSQREKLMPHVVDAMCRKTLNPPWAKLYRRDLIESNNIRFPIGASVGEDRVFNIKYSMYVESYAVSDKAVYVVSTENDNSLSRRRHDDLEQQFEIDEIYFQDALEKAPISKNEKDQYRYASNFGTCRGIYHDAKLMWQDHIGWFQRQKKLGKLCDAINRKHMRYPNTHYCNLIALPIRLRLTPVIDVIAWKLTH